MLQSFGRSGKYIIRESEHPDGVIDYRIAILIVLVAITVCAAFNVIERNKKR